MRQYQPVQPWLLVFAELLELPAFGSFPNASSPEEEMESQKLASRLQSASWLQMLSVRTITPWEHGERSGERTINN